ncbi:phosphoketolase family protein [Rhodococcus sp. (in: high G+C Gram-positive bacteria)]|uniref:phosphoketolase family protein n=1 Tax=Rhodococcus sp. TaxID=1831 RepID=UPI002579D13D|nr:phosphoketolase family protein [Rhodococcus sp. (in: high G+C Gram-positive bacteria)]MBQ7805181.1 phosphoketolase family protein [Rhodococcus sp. (in: high G+C Gram-positive bacteria)]
MTDHHYSEDQLALDLKWWAAANYLTVAQIYLKDNTLLREPLRAEHIKPRLLGHWGTSPGLSMIYTLLNRHIVATGADWLYVTGPGHGGPALVASTYLEGTYSEIYPEVSDDAEGIHRMCRRFSAPGGVPSHVSVQTPGSIHEGGELGYALAHAAGAAFDHPNLVVACVIGDGEAETGPLSGSWKLPAFLNPRRDGAVLPILHVNGAKIAGPTVYGRSSDEDIQAYLGGQGWAPIVVSGDDPDAVFPQLYQAISQAHEKIREMQGAARRGEEWTGSWPAIVLRTPKGWTGPHTVDGILVEGTHRAHQVPLSGVRSNESHLRQLEEWMRSYRPDELFDANGSLVAELAALSPTGDKRMGSTPYANGGRLRVDLPMPPLEKYALPIQSPGSTFHETTRVLGELLRDIYAATETEDSGGIFRLFCPDETSSNRLGAVFETTDRCWQLPITDYDDGLSADGRVMEVLSEHLCEGWLEGYLLSGRHGMFASYEAFAMVSVSMLIQHAKWLQHAVDLPWRASVASLNVLLTSTCWRNDHNGFSHQGPGMIDAVIPLAPSVIRVWLPPDSNTLLSISDHCLRSTDHVNLIVVDKQPHLQYLTLEQAHEHCAAGASVWEWAGTEARGQEPDVVLAAAGDVPTQEILAAAQLLRDHTPELITRVVNVVDLMALLTPTEHPHGFGERVFLDLFSVQTDVVFAFHGYSRAVHELIHGRPSPERFHVRGFSEQGTTTTPFDMVVLNKMSRYHLVIEALRRSKRRPAGASELAEFCRTQLEKHSRYIVEHLEDMPEIENWTWS